MEDELWLETVQRHGARQTHDVAAGRIRHPRKPFCERCTEMPVQNDGVGPMPVNKSHHGTRRAERTILHFNTRGIDFTDEPELRRVCEGRIRAPGAQVTRRRDEDGAQREASAWPHAIDDDVEHEAHGDECGCDRETHERNARQPRCDRWREKMRPCDEEHAEDGTHGDAAHVAFARAANVAAAKCQTEEDSGLQRQRRDRARGDDHGEKLGDACPEPGLIARGGQDDAEDLERQQVRTDEDEDTEDGAPEVPPDSVRCSRVQDFGERDIGVLRRRAQPDCQLLVRDPTTSPGARTRRGWRRHEVA